MSGIPVPSTSKSLIRVTTSGSVNPSATTSISLIGKLQSLEEIIRQMTDEMNKVTRDVQLARTEKDTIDNEMTHRNRDEKELLEMDVNKTEEEMKRHISNQKAENSRLQLQVTQLRGEKEKIQQQIAMLKERVVSLEKLIGEEVQAKCVLEVVLRRLV